MAALYSENDPKAAAWLRELISQGHVAPGVVDERSIEDLEPEYVASFTQFHAFAGIGVWSYSLRQAGWPDDRPVWTGSCPCQPFSAAGKGGGFDDERHLWPAWFWLIDQCRPATVFGEQVASKDGLAWLDLVQADMEGAGYALGALDLCAAGFGAPHIRQRLYFAASALEDAELPPGARQRQHGGQGLRQQETVRLAGTGVAGGLDEPGADTGVLRSELADAESLGRQRRTDDGDAGRGQFASGFAGKIVRPGPVNGFWAASDWIGCTDNRWRPVEPGSFPLAHGAPARVGRLRGYGNAIAAPVATAFIEAYMTC